MGTGKHLILLRGVQGSGKSSFAKILKELAESDLWTEAFHYEADQYFMRASGDYVFNPAELPKAHEYCQNATLETLKKTFPFPTLVVVSNTFSQMWEMEPYIQMAKEQGARLTILTVETTLTDDELAARNAHNCPIEAITRVRSRWECLTKKD